MIEKNCTNTYNTFCTINQIIKRIFLIFFEKYVTILIESSYKDISINFSDENIEIQP